MSRITTIYDALVTRMNTLFPSGSGWQRLSNAYKPEENSDLLLMQGWGIALGPGLNTDRIVNCKFSIEREVTIIFARKYEALENDPTNKAVTEKQLFEDQATLINDIEQDPTLGANATQVRYRSDTGIEYVSGETDRFLMLRSVVAFEYLEDFT